MNQDQIEVILKRYNELLCPVKHLAYHDVVDHLLHVLPQLWADLYDEWSDRETALCIIPCGTFEFMYDDTDELIGKGIVPEETILSARIVVAYGKSLPKITKRDDSRLRGWVGRTEKIYGKEWDKGHFIAHSIGGAVDRAEVNVFRQRRDLNRGWSEEGKVFRQMEEYCFQHSGTFCFNKPHYTNQSDKPSYLEFGILKDNKEFWIEFFNNQL